MSMKPSKFTNIVHSIFSSDTPVLGGKPALLATMLALVIACACTPVAMAAEPSSGPLPLKLDLSGSAVEITTKTQSIPDDGKFLWTATLTPSEQARSAQVVFEVRRPNNSLIFRRTQYVNDIQAARKAFLETQADAANTGSTATGSPANPPVSTPPAVTPYTQTLDFSRELTGLSMPEGLYSVAVEITIDSGSTRETAILNSSQFVYNPNSQTLNTVLGARFSLPPLRDPKGVFISNPAGGSSESLRLALNALIESAKTHSFKPTVYISPLLFEEWTDVADGYQVQDLNEKPVAVAGNSTTAKNYAATLALLKTAVASDSISLGILGFADPDLSKMADPQSASLIDTHYQRAISTYKAAGFSEVAATAPLGSVIGKTQLEHLAALNITSVMLPETSLAEKAPRLSLFESTLKVFKIDAKLSAQLTTWDKTTPIQELLFRAYTSKNNRLSYLPVLADITSSDKAQAFTSNILQIESAPWLKVAKVDSVSTTSAPATKLTSAQPPQNSTADIRATKAAIAGVGLTVAIPQDARALSLRDKGLTAQNATPASSATRAQAQNLRISYADTTVTEVEDVFSAIDIKIAPVTLSGNSGVVPITINNDSKTPMNVVITLKPGPDMKIEGDQSSLTQLPPQETFLEPTISLTNRIMSKLTIVISAGSYTICEKSVDIRASYIDTIAIVAIVTLLGLGLLVYIYKRVKRSSPPEDRLRQTSERAL